MQTDHFKARYLFKSLAGESSPDDMTEAIRSFWDVEYLYVAATREIVTRLENLHNEFTTTMNRKPIYQVKTRIKTPKSIAEKLIRIGCNLSIQSAKENLNDIAGVRIICPYINDTYLIAQLLISQDNVELLRKCDYIQNPKPNGYRSLHLVVTVPVFLSKGAERVKVEIQIRTFAMDLWATLEHDLVYKLDEGEKDDVVKELKECADVIAHTDTRMQKLYNMVCVKHGFG